ncbi:hypothetical protein RTCIAT899_PB02230 (plasmid) [Rhizobium tropici CIAT 899]|nr:hypothetical protein RTCIAT899_PB02230 [Rhizobium tropici CIAT 899]
MALPGNRNTIHQSRGRVLEPLCDEGSWCIAIAISLPAD